MNLLIVNQSIIDTCASFFILLTAAVQPGGTSMSRDSPRDQFVCRIWHSRLPLWNPLIMSTYCVFVTALERYVAVIYPLWYKTQVKQVCFK